jgi:hypothetical protein
MRASRREETLAHRVEFLLREPKQKQVEIPAAGVVFCFGLSKFFCIRGYYLAGVNLE